MRLLMLVLVVLAGYTVAGDAQETDGAAIELNPLDFVPLEVGNRWVYRHSYNNGMYYAWDYLRYGMPSDEEEEIAYWEAYFKQFEIPGYPLGSPTDTYPDDPTLDPDDPTLVVEITHTEWIDGFEYFVFSEAPYDWPPLPAFFWAGQKVRLSEDGMLLFHRNGTDIPLYDFSPQYEDIEIPAEWYSTSTEYVPVRVGRWMSDRLFYPDHTDVIINPAYRDQTLEVGFHFNNPMEYFLTGWSVRFVKGYGIGLVRREVFGTGTSLLFWNSLSPISAILSGKEVSYEEATGKFVGEPDFSSILGQLGKISINNGGFTVSGFDFSEGTKSEYFFGEKKEGDLGAYQSTWDGFPSTSPYLISYIGMADLGQVDFGRLVSEGPADLRPDPPSCSWRTAPPFCPEGPADLRPDPSTSDDLRWRKAPQEGDTYAIWTQEGGIALMHILDVKHTWRSIVLYILFDYVYYPASDRSPEKTSVQPTSWGQLKQLFLQDSPIKTEQ